VLDRSVGEHGEDVFLADPAAVQGDPRNAGFLRDPLGGEPLPSVTSQRPAPGI
jgi:hypothetical protein